MFTEHEFFFVDKIFIFGLNDRMAQSIQLRIPHSGENFNFPVRKSIDLSEFSRWDRVRIELGLTNKGNSKSPHFYIRRIERYILEGSVSN
ncbi:hypothetical protein [Enterococcus sp. DIV0756]|uniref:hypothetical protein n=1 Tax=Enterococcus sp. DIV0756 TaxID=2774636 RepID=UPI003F28B094